MALHSSRYWVLRLFMSVVPYTTTWRWGFPCWYQRNLTKRNQQIRTKAYMLHTYLYQKPGLSKAREHIVTKQQ
uniref:Putative secreted peptide n=1 Tax=Anopheles braziliensis TaxID=58242 RepID=A0A2M3ZW91_9DIPT